MELSTKQLQKINNFLEAMDVEYIDIRMEMIDHLASEIEENITNIPAFFEEKGFHTPFLKFMMSKKSSLLKEYKNLVKKKKWADYRVIIKKSLLKMLTLQNSLFSVVFCVITWYFTQQQFITTLISLVVLNISFSFYFSFMVHQQIKKLGKIKLLNSYVVVGSFLAAAGVQAINLSGIITGKSHTIGIIVLVISILFQFLLIQTFLSEKEKINQKYAHLITD